MIEIITVRCFRCKKVVDKARGSYNFARCAYEIRVECHGEVDACEVTDQFLAQAHIQTRDLEGVAFAPKGVDLPVQPKMIEAPR